MEHSTAWRTYIEQAQVCLRIGLNTCDEIGTEAWRRDELTLEEYRAVTAWLQRIGAVVGAGPEGAMSHEERLRQEGDR